MRLSGSVKFRCALGVGFPVRRRRNLVRGKVVSGRRRRRLVLVLGRFLRLLLLLGLFLQLLHKLADPLSAVLRVAQILRQLISATSLAIDCVLLLVDLLGLGQQLGNLFLQPLVVFLHALVAHRFVLGRVRLHFGPVQRDRAKLHQSCLLAQAQNLHEESRQRVQVHSPKIADSRVVWVPSPGDHPERHVLVGLPLYLP